MGRWCLLLVVLVTVSCSPVSGARVGPRHKRNALQLCLAINVYTHRRCWDYLGYGCFCGLRSEGNRPLDSVDRCCRSHDQCFSSLGCTRLPWLTYRHSCSRHACTCLDSNHNSCEYRSCMCDVALAECLRGATFNIHYMNYNILNC